MKKPGYAPALSFHSAQTRKYIIKFLFKFMVFQIGNVSVSGVEVSAFPNTWSCGDIFFNTTTNKAAFCSSDTMFKLDVSSLVPFNLSDDLTSDREFFLIDIDQPNQLIFPASLIYSGSIPTTVANFTVKSDEQIVGAFGSASGSAWVKNSKVEISIGSNLSISTQFKSSTAFSFDIYFLNSTSSTIIKKKGQDGVPVDPPIVPTPVYSPTIIIDGGTTGFNFTRNSAENRYLMSGSLEIKHGGTGVSSYSELVKKLVPPHPGDGFYVLKSSATNTWEWVALDTTDMVGSILPPAPIDAGIYKYVLTVNEQNQWSWIRDSGGTTSTGVELPAAPADAATSKYYLTVNEQNQWSWLKDVDLVGSILPAAPADAATSKYYLTVNEQNQWSWLKDVDLVGSILPAAPADAATSKYYLTVNEQNQWSWLKDVDLVGSILPAAPADAATSKYYLTVNEQNQWSWLKDVDLVGSILPAAPADAATSKYYLTVNEQNQWSWLKDVDLVGSILPAAPADAATSKYYLTVNEQNQWSWLKDVDLVGSILPAAPADAATSKYYLTVNEQNQWSWLKDVDLVGSILPAAPADAATSKYYLTVNEQNQWSWLKDVDLVGSILPAAPADAATSKYYLTVNEQNQWSWLKDVDLVGSILPAAPADAATSKYYLTVNEQNQWSWLKDVDLVGSILPAAPADAATSKYYLTVNEQNQWSWLKDVDLVGSILPAAPADAATVDYHLTVDAQNQWRWVKTIQQSSGAGGDPLTDLWLIANSADWEMKVVGPITYTGDGSTPRYAEIIWPDGARGNFIRTEYNFSRGVVSGFILTYDGRTVPSTHRGFGITKRVTQPTITYNPSNFKLTSRPLRVVSGVTPISITGNFGTVQVASGTEVSHVVDVSKVSAESVFTLSVGSMPSWMSFDVLSNTFSGTANEDGSFEVTITATDADRFTASAIITFIVGQQQSDVMGGYLSEGPYLTGSDVYINN